MGKKGWSKKTTNNCVEARGLPSKTWLSNGVELLFQREGYNKDGRPFDVVIVGSGYGGAIAAYELSKVSKQPLSICVLERGKEFLPGAFPSTLEETPKEFRVSPGSGCKPKGNLEGLYDIRLNKDLNIVQANGLGGGSLINAGVMARAKPANFENSRWPKQIDASSIAPYYNDAELMLGAYNIDDYGRRQANNIASHSSYTVTNKGPSKYESLKTLSKASSVGTFSETNITVCMTEKHATQSGISLAPCNLCGDCATGCNNNSKISLDKNLLFNAVNNGVEIFTGATVLRLRGSDSGDTNHSWLLEIVYSDEQLRSRQKESVFELRTSFVILSAGSLGSTEILKRSESDNLKFSPQLGSQFSSNGDMLAVGFGQTVSSNAIVDPETPLSQRGIGPTITGMIDLRDSTEVKNRFVIQEMAVPGALNHLFAELYSTLNTSRKLWEFDTTRHSKGSNFVDPAKLDSTALRNTSLYAIMGNDSATGKLILDNSNKNHHEGTIEVNWPKLKNSSIFERQIKYLENISSKGSNAIGGTILPIPTWQLLKPKHMQMMGVEKGAPLSVHPLGGCPMGESIIDGVTNHRGQVFKPGDGVAGEDIQSCENDNPEFHRGLLVLDGAIIPESVGINPALTISAVSLKAIRELIDLDYFKLNREDIGSKPAHHISKTTVPIIRSIEHLDQKILTKQTETEIQLTERLIGISTLADDDGKPQKVAIELTLWSKPLPVEVLSKLDETHAGSKPSLQLETNKLNPINGHSLSKIRVYHLSDWERIRSGKVKVDEHELALDSFAKFVGSLNGSIDVLNRAQSSPVTRIVKSGWSWLLNRGMRDFVQLKRSTVKPKKSTLKSSNRVRHHHFVRRSYDMIRSFTHAGEIRTLDYNLNIYRTIKSVNFDYLGPVLKPQSTGSPKHKRIIASKFLSYTRRANPWTQLSEIYIRELPSKQRTGLPSLRPSEYGKHTLALDMNYLAQTGVPLIKITKQENQFKALLDISSYAAYLTRVLLSIHFYSFRAPDLGKPKIPQRFAQKVRGLPSPTTYRIIVDQIPDNLVKGLNKSQNVEIVLTHYKSAKDSLRPPVLMIHGYSGNSAFFAHPSIPNGLAKFMHDQYRDIWLVDLRTSSALDSARYPWEFERIADNDIPKAISHIYQHYQGKRKIDIIAHCMGAIMLGMSVLRPKDGHGKDSPHFYKQRINRIVFSQATPTVIFKQENNFRSFLTSYFKELIPVDYQFQTTAENTPTRLLDRLLYSLPYPKKEYDLVNPPLNPSHRAEFVRTRHRVDALFSRTFELKNLSPETLEHIDDFFGPIHVDTIVQASRFSYHNVATNPKGGNSFVNRNRLREFWGTIPTMSFHARSNGLIDFSTAERSQEIFLEAGVPYHSEIIPNHSYGHQDSILGINSHKDVFPIIRDFLNKDTYSEKHSAEPQSKNSYDQRGWIVEAPAHGPIIINPTHGGQSNGSQEMFTKIMVGSNTARACNPICIFLPVTHDNAKLEIAGKNTSEKEGVLKRSIVNSLKLTCSHPSNRLARWHILEVPNTVISRSSKSMPTMVDGIACLLLYNDLHTLDSRLVVDSYPIEKVVQSTRFRSFNEHSRKNPTINAELGEILSDFIDSNRNVYDEFAKSLIEYSSPIDDVDKNKSVVFALGSCQYPAGILDADVAYQSYQELNLRLNSDRRDRPDFVALIGDQIYADATAGLLDPTTKFDRFVLPYYRLYKNKHVRAVLRKLPMYAMLDDHELCDNWEPVINNEQRHKELDEIRTEGIQSFLKFQRGKISNLAISSSEAPRDPLWYHFEVKGFPFFMCDTRTERSPRCVENIMHPDTTIINKDQEYALRQWLLNTSFSKTKFIISSSMLLPRHCVQHGSDNNYANSIRSDGWDGYPVSLFKTLAMIVDNMIENVVFLSGDEHIGCYAKIKVKNLKTNCRAKMTSIHCPGLYTPFPFANTHIEDLEGSFVESENSYISDFEFTHDGSRYHCEVSTRHEITEAFQRIGPVEVDLCKGFLIIKAKH